jgi:hypothetical protein
MTYYEVLYWWAWLIVPIFVAILTTAFGDEEDIGLFVIFTILLLFVGGLITASIKAESKDYKITSKFETIPKVVHLDDTGLNIITDEDKHVKYTNHKDISIWKNGGKIYKVYSFNKENFGIDSEKSEILIEKGWWENE